ncbi:hypothetical protein [Rubritalea tangerina]|uniref:Uncharacterized protein n=1 Tax=Rubritalea tangerina TaxID=430798 RepID=A0ABW4Z645_9BACT
MTITAADETLVSAFLYDFQCEVSVECIRYIAPDSSFEVAIQQGTSSAYDVSIKVLGDVGFANSAYGRAKNFLALVQ